MGHRLSESLSFSSILPVRNAYIPAFRLPGVNKSDGEEQWRSGQQLPDMHFLRRNIVLCFLKFEQSFVNKLCNVAGMNYDLRKSAVQ